MSPRLTSTERRTASPNRLLASLPRRDSGRLLAACDPVELEFGAILFEPDSRIRDVYFPTDSFVSLLIPVDGKNHLEVGMVGNEGMVGVPLVLGVDRSELRALVQGAGPAWQMSARAFTRELGASAGLRSALHRYLQVRMAQFAQAAACTRFHLIEGRLVRWLLMTQDRAHDSQFHVTHEVLAHMLGVRRVGVTRAANALQKRKLIRYHRGEVTILNRAAMEAASCGCYRADLRMYKNLLGGT
ncbi:MAG TPA: Crp/Fnr family transcriptional regulator [Burkholderiaceae bacterium]|nr:Crp/Fnr family transcriptional regulator [Burkholderiaceae bacterium]